MIKKLVVYFSPVIFVSIVGQAQIKSQVFMKDSSDEAALFVELEPVVLKDSIKVDDLVKRLKNDTTFYKAFKNLNVLNYKANISGRMFDRKGDHVQASIRSNIRQEKRGKCVSRIIENEQVQGKLKHKNGEWIYYTCKLFGNLFLEEVTECGKNNIVGSKNLKVDDKDGLEKRVEQIKILVFNPGQKIPDFFFFGNKVGIFDKELFEHYDYTIDKVERRGKPCILFKIKAKDDLSFFQKSDIVIDELTTWLDDKTWDIVEKKYVLSYNLGVMSFNISMQVEVEQYKQYLHPTVIRYSGKWSVPFYKQEDGTFNVFLHSFSDKDLEEK